MLFFFRMNRDLSQEELAIRHSLIHLQTRKRGVILPPQGIFPPSQSLFFVLL
ncbi:hypothetical protein HMPREF1869_00616 [Bacteroidales bacterium KA00251]|nr:hypothetical protein HMPREF1869_00616 [Bacteroidales bacterium KA00251]